MTSALDGLAVNVEGDEYADVMWIDSDAHFTGRPDTRVSRVPKSLRERVPVKRVIDGRGAPEEIAAGVAYLASDDASYVRGADMR